MGNEEVDAAIFKTSVEPSCAEAAMAQKRIWATVSSETASLWAAISLKVACNSD